MDLREQLGKALHSKGVRVADLIRNWDKNGDGAVSRAEFVKVIGELVHSSTAEQASALFDTIDTDGSGEMNLGVELKAFFMDIQVHARTHARTQVTCAHGLLLHGHPGRGARRDRARQAARA